MTLLGSGLRFHFKAQRLDENSFGVIDFAFKESLSSPFSVTLNLLSRLDNLTPEDIVDQAGLMSWSRDGVIERHVHGIVSQFSKGETGHRHTQYQITLTPALSRLTLRQNSRIFQQQSIVAIISTLLDEMGISDYAFSCDARFTSQVREYCVQYRETDFDFISRLAAEVGLFYYFEHSETLHTLIFCDSTSKLSLLSTEFPYNALSGGVSEKSYISAFRYQHQVKPAKVSLKDYSFKKPKYSFLQQSTGNHLAFQESDYEHFDYPGRYKDDATGVPITKVRQEYLRRDAQKAFGQSNVMAAISGSKFNLTEHNDKVLNHDWLFVKIEHTGEQGAAAEEANTEKPTTYHNTFEVIPAINPWQAEPDPKPLVTGPQMAMVVGPENEEIFCDEYGRVKVQLPWDREGKNDGKSSCWIRVSQGWAGGQYGMMAIPRIGHEVIVSFLEGDPDQPIITGRTFNSVSQVPYPLPANKTRTTIKTKTHKGKGSNELRFEDKADKEEIYIHAQKDMDVQVRNSKNERVDFNRTTSIGHDEHIAIAHNLKLTVEGQQDHVTKGDYLTEVEGDKHSSIKGDMAEKVSGLFGLNADGDITIKSGNKLTLQVGGSFVVISASGVDINGAKINLNSGGSPGSLPLPDSAAVLTAAAGEGAAFVANCPP